MHFSVYYRDNLLKEFASSHTGLCVSLLRTVLPYSLSDASEKNKSTNYVYNE